MTRKVAKKTAEKMQTETTETVGIDDGQFASNLQLLLEPALGAALTGEVKQRLLEHYGPNVKLTAEKVQRLIAPLDQGMSEDAGTASNQFGRAYNRFGRAYNRFSRAYNRFSR